jgi:hypothetical protein
MGEKLANVEAGVIGLVISSLYQKLDKMGFSSGQEFITAIREADAAGATVVLGDRPVDVTLKRLQESIDTTGLKQVMAFANSQAESSDDKVLSSKLDAKETSVLDAAGILSFARSLARARSRSRLSHLSLSLSLSFSRSPFPARSPSLSLSLSLSLSHTHTHSLTHTHTHTHTHTYKSLYILHR